MDFASIFKGIGSVPATLDPSSSTPKLRNVAPTDTSFSSVAANLVQNGVSSSSGITEQAKEEEKSLPVEDYPQNYWWAVPATAMPYGADMTKVDDKDKYESIASSKSREDARYDKDNGSFLIDEDPWSKKQREAREKAGENFIKGNRSVDDYYNLANTTLAPETLGMMDKKEYYDPYMTFLPDNPFKTYSLEEDSNGLYLLPDSAYKDLTGKNVYGADLPAGGSLADKYFTYKSEDGYRLLPDNPNMNQDAIGYYGGTSIEDPNSFDRDAIELLSNEDFINTMQKDYGLNNFHAGDLMTLRTGSDPQTREAWMYFMDQMHDLGYYDEVYSDPRFLDESGNLDPEKFWDWIDANANVLDYVNGNISDEGADWILSGGLANQRLLADFISAMDLPYKIDSESFAGSVPFKKLQQAIADGTYQEDEEKGYSYVPGEGVGFKIGDDGNYYAYATGEEGTDNPIRLALLNDILRGSLTNSALGDSYEDAAQSAVNANILSDILYQADLYKDNDFYIPEEVFPSYNWNEDEEQYRNYLSPEYSSLLQYLNSAPTDFRLGPTAGANNPYLYKTEQKKSEDKK